MKDRRNPFRASRRRTPVLRFNPWAWSKLLYLRDRGPTEIGGFGIASADNLLLIEDFVLVRQTCSSISVAFDDRSVADYFDRQVDLGRRPEEFGRVWLHTHPGDSANPSRMDERTFDRVFGGCSWAVMFILARGGQTYARLRLNVGPGAEVDLPIELDFTQPFEATDFETWDTEYQADVVPEVLVAPPAPEAAAAPGLPPRKPIPHPFADPFADLLEPMDWR